MHGSREDEEWCDVANEDIPKMDAEPAGHAQDVDGASGKNGDAGDTSMPTLFSTNLPPCGLLPQLAYENIVHRLRALWHECSQNPSANISVPSLCREVLDALKTEEDQPVSQTLNPYRRPSVFMYEIRWARYFMREAETMEKRPGMTEKQADKQDFMDRMYPIPKELKIVVANRKNQKQILDLWKAWHHGKRGTVETEDPGLGVGGAREDGGEQGEDGKTEVAAGEGVKHEDKQSVEDAKQERERSFDEIMQEAEER
ncbi:hypothetical protein ACET3X_008766 [Alternaria dauci]|uniref:Uncharacterized protein n=1 Tax=Alternaria dauci TaxID=48095 RepID=A0ABR3UD80_9PLEO